MFYINSKFKEQNFVNYVFNTNLFLSYDYCLYLKRIYRNIFNQT